MWWKWGGRRRPGSSRAAGSCATWASPENSAVEAPGRGQPPGPALPVDRPQDPREDPLEDAFPTRFRSRAPTPVAVGPREDDGRDAGVEVDRQGGRDADERQAQVFGHGPARHLDLIDEEGVDALVADRGRGVPEEHHRLPLDPAKSAPQGGEALELAELLVPRADRAAGEVFPADLAELAGPPPGSAARGRRPGSRPLHGPAIGAAAPGP